VWVFRRERHWAVSLYGAKLTVAVESWANPAVRVCQPPGPLWTPETDRSNSALSGPGSENLRTSRWSGYKFSSDSESLRTSLPSGYNDPDVVSKSSACRCLRQLTPWAWCVCTAWAAAWSCSLQIARARDWGSWAGTVSSSASRPRSSSECVRWPHEWFRV